jgi:hypothetical protein
MSRSNPLDFEDLVAVHKAGNEWEGNLIVSYLRENGIEATLESPPSVSPLDVAEELSGSNRVDGVLVFRHDADRARALIKEFLARQPSTEP